MKKYLLFKTSVTRIQPIKDCLYSSGTKLTIQTKLRCQLLAKIQVVLNVVGAKGLSIFGSLRFKIHLPILCPISKNENMAHIENPAVI